MLEQEGGHDNIRCRASGKETKLVPGLLPQHKLGEALRNVQRKTGCTTRTLSITLQELRSFLKEEYQQDLPHSNFRSIDKVINAKYEVISLKLNGCVGCNKYVFIPSDKTKRCPLCRFPRHNVKGQPNEVSVEYDNITTI